MISALKIAKRLGFCCNLKLLLKLLLFFSNCSRVATYGSGIVRRVGRLRSVTTPGHRGTRPSAGSAGTAGRPDEVLDLGRGHRPVHQQV